VGDAAMKETEKQSRKELCVTQNKLGQGWGGGGGSHRIGDGRQPMSKRQLQKQMT
jgi:hypothetical protein